MTGLLLDAVGWAGAAALLLAYGLVSAGRLDARSLRFQLFNLAGAVGLLSNGIWHGAWPSAALNAVWLLIGITAVRKMRNSRTHRPSPMRLGTSGRPARAGDRRRTAETARPTRLQGR